MTAAAPSPTAANGSVATQRPTPASGNVGEGRGPVDPLIAQLRDLRIKAGLTQTQVAEASGTSQQHLSQVENGRQQPSLGWLRAVAQVLGVQPGPLVPLAYETGPVAPRDDTCYDPQCNDSTWDHDCPTPAVPGGYTVTANGVTRRAVARTLDVAEQTVAMNRGGPGPAANRPGSDSGGQR